MKQKQDDLAHRFFRNHDLDMITVAGCHIMIDELFAIREKLVETDKRLDELVGPAFARIGFDLAKLREGIMQAEKEILEEAKIPSYFLIPSGPYLGCILL